MDRQSAPIERYRLSVAIAVIVAVACFGGASRHDETQQMLVRLAALMAIAASLWPLRTRALRNGRWTIIGIGAVYLLVLAQLVPLPPALWASLPGHAVYADIASTSNTAGWRPLSLTPDLTLNALFALLPMTAAAIAMLYLDARGRFLLAHWIVGVACLSAFLALAQLAAGGSSLHLFRLGSDDAPIGLFANRNHQAALMACGLPITGALASLRLRNGDDRRIVLASASGIITLLLLVLVSTGSRMGLVLGLIGMAGAAWCWRSGGQRLFPRHRRARLAAIGTAAMMIIALGAMSWRGGAIERLRAADVASDTRAATFAPLIVTARAFMPLGAGFGAFDSVYRRFEPDSLLLTTYLNEAHDEPVQLAIEGGVPALILLALFLVGWARNAVRVIAAKDSVSQRTLGLAGGVVTVILMASSLVDYPLRTPLLSALFAISYIQMSRAGLARPSK